MTRFFPLLAGCAALGACGAPSPVAKDARNTVAVPVASTPRPVANASGGPTFNQAAPAAIPAALSNDPAPKLPASFIGRWGLTPADCTSTTRAPKGLLVVSPQELHFYESRGVPTGDVQADATSAAGTFHFTGEGRSWPKYEALQLQRTMLVRTESNPTASFTYAKCS